MILEVQGSIAVLYFPSIRNLTTSNPLLLTIFGPDVGSFANDKTLRNDERSQRKRMT